jgi:hypothetical protein
MNAAVADLTVNVVTLFVASTEGTVVLNTVTKLYQKPESTDVKGYSRSTQSD